MTFQGSLQELHLPDVIQLVSVSGKSGVFVLNRRGEEGYIYLENGHIVHAVLGRLLGEEAVYTLATWNEGSFHFMPGEDSPTRTITKNNTNLLMEAARRLDEWRVLSKRIPSLDRIPKFKVPEGKQGQINLNTQEWLILSKIDGGRSIEEIAETVNLSTFDVAKLLYGLVTMGLIFLEEAPAKAEPPPIPMEAQGEEDRPEVLGSLLGLIQRLRDEARAILGSPSASAVNGAYTAAKRQLDGGQGTEAVQLMCQEILRLASEVGGPESQRLLAQQFRDILSSWNSPGS
jgi:hypothetical protein